jgi:hypothetical protein
MTDSGCNEDKEARRPIGKVDAQEMVLALYLGNAATNRQWFEQMVKATPPKKDRQTGEPKPGISERTFNRQRKEIVARGHAVVSGAGQGKIYSIVAGPWAQDGSAGKRGGGFLAWLNLPSTVKVLTSGDDLITEVLRHARLRK